MIDVNVRAYGATGNGTTDDTTAIQNAINACPVGGTVGMPTGRYRITSTLVIDKMLTLVGSGICALYGSHSTAWDSNNIPTTSPYLSGAVLVVDTAATDAINITAAGVTVNLRDFGIYFKDPTIIYRNTGHGSVVAPPALSGHYDNGLMGGNWKNLMVMGHDGNHYAYKIKNSLYGHFEQLHGFGGGGLMFEADGVTSPAQALYGGAVFDDPYFQVYVGGSAHGYYLKATQGYPNIIQFNRPQATVGSLPSEGAVTPDFMSGVSAPTSAQYEYYEDTACDYCVCVAADFETNVGSGTHYGTHHTNY